MKPKQWYSPSEISFSYYQNFFLLYHYGYLKTYTYPPEVSSYTQADARPPERSYRTPHEMITLIKAELDLRLSKCGTDGKLLLAECQLICHCGVCAVIYDEIPYLSPESKSALGYISSKLKRRKQSYSKYKIQRRYAQKIDKKILKPKKVVI